MEADELLIQICRELYHGPDEDPCCREMRSVVRTRREEFIMGIMFLDDIEHGRFDPESAIVQNIFDFLHLFWIFVRIALDYCIQKHLDRETRCLIQSLKQARTAGHQRGIILHSVFKTAARLNNVDVGKLVLDRGLHRFDVMWLYVPLQIACREQHLEFLALVANEIAEGGYIIYGNRGLEMIRPYDISYNRRAWRALLLEKALEVSIERNIDATTIILSSYYDVFSAYFTDQRDRQRARQILDKVTDGLYYNLTRETSLRLLSLELPRNASQIISRRLGMNSISEPKDICLGVEGHPIKIWAHKDVLSYWSPYFNGAFHSHWAKNDHITFDKSIISPLALKTVVDFAYSGFLNYRNTYGRNKDTVMENIEKAANYFGIEKLEQLVEETVAKRLKR